MTIIDKIFWWTGMLTWLALLWILASFLFEWIKETRKNWWVYHFYAVACLVIKFDWLKRTLPNDGCKNLIDNLNIEIRQSGKAHPFDKFLRKWAEKHSEKK